MDYRDIYFSKLNAMCFFMLFTNGLLCAQNNKVKLESSLVVASEVSYEFKSDTFQKTELILKPEFVLKFKNRSKVVLKSQVYSEFQDNLETGQPTESMVSGFNKRIFIGDRTNLELRELYYYINFKKIKVSIGKQQIVWGETDGLKLLDVVNPQNFREFILDDFEDSRIPLWSLKTDFKISDLNIQLVWIPDNTYHITQDFNAPFFTKNIFKTPPEGISMQVNQTKRPAKFIKDSDVGFKLSGFKKGWDFSLNYLYYYDDLPVFYSNFNNQATTIEISPAYERQHLIGGTFNKVFGSTTFRGELVYIFDQNFTSVKTINQGIEQADLYKSAFGLDVIKGEYIISLQLFNEWVTKHISPYNRDLFETNGSLLASKEFMNDNLKAEMLCVHSFNHTDGYVTPQLSYWLTTNTQLLLNSHIFYGKENLLFGQFKNRSRVSMGFKWSI